jgi:trehalose/maltose hydrolase-like predicted phosphorylase
VENHWKIQEHTFTSDIKQIRSQETVFTIGNGYFCTRGSFEEGYPHATPATLLYGIFDDIPISKEELANTPDWLTIQLFVNGERFRMDRGQILAYKRTLDMKTAVVARTVHWKGDNGVVVRIQSERFASLADQHVGIIHYNVMVEESPRQQAVHIQLRAGLNTAQSNQDVMHWETVDQGHQQDRLWLLSETRHSAVRLAQVVSLRTDTPEVQKEIIDSDIDPSIHLSTTLTPGETLNTEKILVMYTSRGESEPLVHALTHHERLRSANIRQGASSSPFIYDALFAQHKKVWHDFWQEADVVLEGDIKAQLGLRYSIYQLRINASDNDDRYSIAAKGLTGCGYHGHIFHDTEIFMLPFFTYELPHIARNLLLYRYHLLPAAHEKARANGYNGAQYPWESTLDGQEATPPSMIHPETGQIIAVLNGFIELHITSSIAYATWEYWRITGDNEFLRDYGAEILLSTALFWDSRAEPKGDHYEINDVIGPDEWHEHVNNNAHTNFMAQDNLQNALAAYEWLQANAPEKAQELAHQLDMSEQRLAHMRDVCEHLHLPIDPETGLIEQFDGFFQLKKLDQNQYLWRKQSYQAILGQEKIQEYQLVKQADTLMMLTMLRQKFDRKVKETNWNYYFPITDHDYGSSLTPAFHAILASELGHPEDAYNMFMKGALVDLENQRGNTPEGIHAACAGAVWQAAIFGFAGLRVTNEGYTTNPCWPDGWQRLAFSFKHKGKPIYIDLNRA